MPPTPKAIRVRTATGWQDIALSGQSMPVYEQPNQPTEPVPSGALWIDTDDSALWWTYDSDPVATIKAYAGTVIPKNWMIADGSSLARANYPELADAMGVAAGATNFTIPDLRNKFIYGGSVTGVGATGGAATHTLSVAEMPSHQHQIASIGNIHDWAAGVGSQNVGGGAWTGNRDYINSIASGGGGAHNNMPPYITLAYIIKVTGPQINAGGALQGPKGDPGTLPVFTSLPVAPSDGMMIAYLADATQGIVWHLRYRAAASGSYKWEFVGGSPLTNDSDTEFSAANSGGGFIDLTPVQSMTIPVAGDYIFETSAFSYSTTVGTQVAITAAGPAGYVARMDTHAPGPAYRSILSTRQKVAAVGAGSVYKMQTYISAQSTIGSRRMSAIPVRVG